MSAGLVGVGVSVGFGVFDGFGVGVAIGVAVGRAVAVGRGVGEGVGVGRGDGDGDGPIVITGIGVGVASMPRLGSMIAPKVSPGPRLVRGGSDPIATSLGNGEAEPMGTPLAPGRNAWAPRTARMSTIRMIAESRPS